LKAWTITNEVMEQPENRFSYDHKAQMVKEMQDYRTAIDCSGLCFNAARGVDAELLASLISALAGFDLSESGFKEIGERVWNLERMLAVSEGIQRREDTLPSRFFEEALPDGNAKGAMMDRSGFERMLSEYYHLRGWDVETGIPLPSTLKTLGLANSL
jgi:aldehyde:ferredoxin oxidoreductase